MRYAALVVWLLIAVPCWSQTTSTGTAETQGPCSPAVTGSNNQFTIKCEGIPDKLGTQLVDLLNRVAKNQVDAQAIMAKLDSCLQGTHQVREEQKPWRLGEDQKKQLKQSLQGMQAKVVEVESISDPNAVLLASDLRDTLGIPPATDLISSNPFEGILITTSPFDVRGATLLQQSLSTVLGIKKIYLHPDAKTKNLTIIITVGAKPQPPSP